jgi:Uri superfamily endonuclease
MKFHRRRKRFLTGSGTGESGRVLRQRSLMKKMSEKVRWGYDYLKTKSPFFLAEGEAFFQKKHSFL